MKPCRGKRARVLCSAFESTEDRAGKFVILTSVRRDEALEARWSEFDFVERVWTIPAEQTNRRKVYKVPVTDAIIAVLGTPGAPDAFVFPSSRTGRKMGNKALDKDWFARNGATAHATLHGFRSSMTDWVADYEADDFGVTRPTLPKNRWRTRSAIRRIEAISAASNLPSGARLASCGTLT